MRWTWQEFRAQPAWYIAGIWRRLKGAQDAEERQNREITGRLARR